MKRTKHGREADKRCGTSHAGIHTSPRGRQFMREASEWQYIAILKLAFPTC